MLEMEVTPAGAVQVPDEVNTTSCVTGPGGPGGGGGGGGPGVGGVGVGVGISAKVPAPLALRPPRVKIIGTSYPLDELGLRGENGVSRASGLQNRVSVGVHA